MRDAVIGRYIGVGTLYTVSAIAALISLTIPPASPYALQRCFHRLSACVDYCRWSCAAHRNLVIRDIQDGTIISWYIALCAVISFISTLFMTEYSRREIHEEYEHVGGATKA